MATSMREILIGSTQVDLSLVGEEDTVHTVAVVEHIEGKQAVASLLEPWRGSLLAPGAALSIGVASGDLYYRGTAEVEAFHPPSLVTFELVGAAENVERREYMRVSDDLELSYGLLLADDFQPARMRILNRRRVILSRATPASNGFRPSLGNELDYIARRIDDIEAKLDRLLAASESPRMLKRYQAGDKRTRWVNISGSGLRFAGDLACRAGDLLEVTIDLPLDPPIEVALVCQVLDVSEDHNGNHGPDAYVIGCSFLAVHDRERDDIVRYTFQRQRLLLREQHRTGLRGAR